MLQTRQEREQVELGELAPYAVKSGASLGRAHEEEPHAYRTAFQRDRDRVLHSRCFRRLEYKTQVFINGTADHYRTRLTHTFEMAAVGRTLARALRANEDLAECIALAHDIGHSPFGHCGEEVLDELMKEHGGFDHNLQSVRWVEYLERRYPAFNGLNLTWEVRAGLRKHQAALPGQALDGIPIGPWQQIEAQIADLADDITYHAHDIDDGLEAGLLRPEQLRELELWRMAEDRASSQGATHDHELRLTAILRALLDLQVEDILVTSSDLLDRHQPGNARAVMTAPVRLLSFSPDMARIQKATRAFLFENMYWHPAVSGANQEAVRMMRRLFLHYVQHPEVMGGKARGRIDTDGLWRAACDYVSGMTDRYAMQEYQKFGLGV